MSAERAAAVLERLLLDATFRAQFRGDPAAALRRCGLPDVAEEVPGARALQTLAPRESRSNLAGLFLSVAAEGIAALDALTGYRGPGGGGPAAAVAARTLARPRVRALTQATAAAPPPPAAAEPPTTPPAAVNPPGAPPAAVNPPGAPPVAVDPPGAPPATSGSAGAPSAPAEPPTAPPASRPVSFGPVARPHDARTALVPSGGAEPPKAPSAYPGDDASPARIAAWMGVEARRAGLPPELPVMAALQESGLRNLDGGDRDSVGFFQMRLGIWNKGAYQGFPQRPELQMRWFISRALAVRAGNPGLAADSSRWNEWIADIELCAEENRGRYGPHLAKARELLAAGGHRSRPPSHREAPPAPRRRTGVQPAARDALAHAADADGLPDRMLKVAARELGVRETSWNDSDRIADYRTATPGGSVGPWCAYFVSWVARRAGVPLGDHDQGFASVDALWSWAQQSGHTVAAGSPPRPGDLIVWDEHVGIVEKVEADGVIHTIEGNTSDQVARRTHTSEGVVGFVRLRR